MKYECTACKARGVKLWRQYNTFLSHIDLLCRVCAIRDQAQSIANSMFEAERRAPSKIHLADTGHVFEFHRGILIGDQIGGLVPAAPTELPDAKWVLPAEATFWGYTSVPEDKVNWWKELAG